MNIGTINIDLKKLGQNLRNLRTGRELTQAELGKYLGVKVNNIARWERGEVMPSLEMSWRFSQFFNVTIDSLVK